MAPGELSGILNISMAHTAWPLLTYYNFVDLQDEDGLFKAEAVLSGEELLLPSCWDKHPPWPLSVATAIEAGIDGSSACYIDMERNSFFELKLEGRRSILCEGGDLGYFSAPIPWLWSFWSSPVELNLAEGWVSGQGLCADTGF